MPDLFSTRAANAANPAGCIRFSLVRSTTRRMLIALQMLSRRREVNRIT